MGANEFQAHVTGTDNIIGSKINESLATSQSTYSYLGGKAIVTHSIITSYDQEIYTAQQFGSGNIAITAQDGSGNALHFYQGLNATGQITETEEAAPKKDRLKHHRAADHYNDNIAETTTTDFIENTPVDDNRLDTDQLGSEHEIYIYQYGNANSITADQTNSKNVAEFYQLGDADTIIGEQHGVANSIFITQDDKRTSRDRNVDYLQMGNDNETLIRQKDNKNSPINGAQTVKLYQDGNDSYASIIQTNGEADADLRQDGNKNQARIYQRDGIAESNVTQEGNKNKAYINQDDDWNAAPSAQVLATILQDGKRNEAEIFQSSGVATAEITQTGNDNYGYIDQRSLGWNKEATILSTGNNNSAHIYQNGDVENAIAEIEQFGNDNIAEVTQANANGELTLEQIGNNNQFFATQSEEGLTLRITQFGDGNNLTVNNWRTIA